VSGNPNGEAEVVEVKLSQSSTARKKVFEYDFSELEIKGRGARGNTITKYPIRRVDFLQAGTSTLSKMDLWYDDAAGRLNRDHRGHYLGKFDGDDQIICFLRNGSYKITSYDLANRYEPEKTLRLEKFHPKKPVSAVYVDGESKQHMVKRFLVETTTADKEFGFISETIGSRLVVATLSDSPEVEVQLIKGKGKDKTDEVMNLEDLIDVKGWKALGNRLSQFKVVSVKLVEDEEDAGPQEKETEEEDEASEATGKGTRGSQELKKKADPNEWLDEGEQANLFEEPPKNQAPSHQQKPAPAKPKVKAEQQDLFGEKQEDKKEENEVSQKPGDGKDDPKSFQVGDTIEFSL
jgi:topoisomerase-4 subunit A